MSAARRAGGIMTALAAFVGSVVVATSALATPPAGSHGLAARGLEPVLLSGPSTGATIRIWSRFDGLQRKLAWSRFENGRWSDPRVVTFGPGDDLAPAAGISSTGSMLYWADEHGRVIYAPFDPESGRLFAVPRPLPITPLRPHGPATEGGTDAPVILGNCEKSNNEPCVGQAHGAPVPINSPPAGPGLEGGTDIPIVLTTGSTSITTVTVASAPTCGTQVVSIASGGMVAVVAIDGSARATLLGRFVLDTGVDPSEATAAAGTYFHQRTCN
jgi:hypothetical protein